MAKSLDRFLQKHTDTPIHKRGDCLALWAALRHSLGMGHTTPHLLGNPLDNVKIRKSIVPTWTLTLAAHSTSGEVNTCDKSTPECRKVCVMLTSGNARYLDVQNGRRARTIFAAQHPEHFLSLLTHEVAALNRRGTPFGLRLNVASDLRWEHIAPWLFDGPNVRAYDYTKWAAEDRDDLDGRYHLTYSHSERWTNVQVVDYVEAGRNVAVVFDAHKHDLPTQHLGLPVIDGDVSDFRWDDPKGVIVGLAAKGEAKTLDVGGFKQAGGA
jgi:hypothetical protein